MNLRACSLRCLSMWLALMMSTAAPAQPAFAGGASRGRLILDQADELRFALEAAPAHLREGASVYVFGNDGYTRIRTGDNGVNCIVNRDRLAIDSNVLRPTCWDIEGSATLLPIALKYGELLAHGKNETEISLEIEGDLSAGRLISPRKAGIAYMLAGDLKYDRATRGVTPLFPPHYMIYAGGVSNADLGLSKEAQDLHPSLPFIYAGYSGGSRTAYLIVLAVIDAASK